MVEDSFYRDIWQAWSILNHRNPKNFDEITEQIIWLNSYIRINNRPIFYRSCIDKEIFRIRDLLNIANELMSFDEFSQRYQSPLNYLQYYGLIAAIPAEWKQVLRNNDVDESSDVIKINLFEEKYLSKKLYNKLIDDNTDLMYAKSKCEINFNATFDFKDYENSLVNLYGITPYTKLRSFQYRLLQNGLITNKHLYKWKLIDTPLCSFCAQETENISHLFITCNITARLWTELKNWIKNKGYQKNIDINNIILNNIENDPKHVINLVVLIAKQYIYKTRCLKTLPNIQELVKHVEEIDRIEKYLAVSQNRIQSFKRKWSTIIND